MVDAASVRICLPTAVLPVKATCMHSKDVEYHSAARQDGMRPFTGFRKGRSLRAKQQICNTCLSQAVHTTMSHTLLVIFKLVLEEAEGCHQV